MNPTRKCLPRTLAAAALVAASLAGPAWAGSLENMERERAIMLQTLLDPNMSHQERHAKAMLSQKRLIDLERIALRDKSLNGRNTPAVQRAFDNYDLTFVVHAAAEKNLTVADHWFEQLGISSQSVMVATRRRR